jgi:hypothetical protein
MIRNVIFMWGILQPLQPISVCGTVVKAIVGIAGPEAERNACFCLLVTTLRHRNSALKIGNSFRATKRFKHLRYIDKSNETCDVRRALLVLPLVPTENSITGCGMDFL